MDRPGLLAAGLRAFFRISGEWDLSEAAQIILLGSTAESELESWRSGDVASGSAETLERISLILGIYKAIQTLLPDHARANNWMRAPNFAPTFSGGSALDQMLRGNIADLRQIRTYFDAQLV